MTITAFIFARSGSKRIPNKNIKNFAGKPLIAWTIQKCISIKKVKRVIVSTDSKKIANIAKYYGAEVPFLRPKSLSKDNSSEFEAWKHALNYIKNKEKALPKFFLSVPPTAPLRSTIDINNCIREIKKNKNDVVLTISRTNHNPYFNMIKVNKYKKAKLLIESKKKLFNLQQSPKIYAITTVAYAARSNFILSNKHIFDTSKIGVVEIPIERSIDIDSHYDFEIAEYFMKRKFKK